MLTFIFVYFSVYGGMHAYFFWKAHRAFSLNGLKLFVLLSFLMLMTLGPILVHLLDRAGIILPAALFSYITYSWMAVILWFLSLGIVLDVFNLMVRAVSRFQPQAARFAIPPKTGFFIIAVMIVGACVWGTIEASSIRVRKVTLTTPLLQAGAKPVRIAQISDLHLGLLVGKDKLTRVLALIRENRPDILVSTGDMVDGIAPHLNHLSELFAAYRPPLGKFAVTGNHEYYAGIDDSLEFHRESGFTVLRERKLEMGVISIAGVDDPAGYRMNEKSMTDEDATLLPPGRKRFTILLKHRPQIRGSSLERFDLQLSGHAHGGQLFPFNYLVMLRYPMIAGLYPLGGGANLYTSRGTGTWGPPMRLSAPPEITIFSIEPVDQQTSAGSGNQNPHGVVLWPNFHKEFPSYGRFFMRRSPAFLLALIFAVTLPSFLFLLPGPAEREAIALADGCRGVRDDNQVVVYYFHRKFACRSCKGIEETVLEGLEKYFPGDFTKGRLAMCTVNLDEPGNRHYLDDFDIVFNSIIVVDKRNGKVVRFKNIENLWEIYPDRKATIEMIRHEVTGFLSGT